MSAALLQVRDLVLGFGRTQVVRGVDLDVREGSIVALIGANGAGKTTTLRGLSGLLAPRSGSVRFDGVEIRGLSAHKTARLGIAHAPEGRRLFGRMTVAENLLMGGYLAQDRRDLQRRRDAVLARFPRLAERLDQSAGLLSGGEQQMLVLGRALMADPRLLLLDEPSMGLAPLVIEEVFRTVSSLRDEGKTILLVEQNARAALGVADAAYVLESGRIVLSGAAADVAGDPAIVSAYLGGA